MLRYDGEPEKYAIYERTLQEKLIEQKLAGYLESAVQKETRVTMPKGLFSKYRTDAQSLKPGEMKIVEMYQKQQREHADAGMSGIHILHLNRKNINDPVLQVILSLI